MSCARDVSSSSSVSRRSSLALNRVKHAVSGVEDGCRHEHAQHDARLHGDAHWHTPKGQPGNAELPYESDNSGAEDGDDEGLQQLHGGITKEHQWEAGHCTVRLLSTARSVMTHDGGSLKAWSCFVHVGFDTDLSAGKGTC